MSVFEEFKAICRRELMQVEVAIVDTYTAELAGRKRFSSIDGGAHVGYHTLRLAALPGCEKVIAVEADPFTVEKLIAKIGKAEDAIRERIEIVQKALQEDQACEEVHWMSSSSHPGRSGVSSIWQNDATVTFREDISVAATTIDRLSADLEAPVAMIKLDLEGGDFMALRGAEETLKRDRPIAVFENSNRAPGIYGYSIADMLAYFASIDYVPVTFAGVPATEENWFTFWEMWAAPKEQADALCKRLQEVTAHLVDVHPGFPEDPAA